MRWADLLIFNTSREVLDFLLQNRFRVIGTLDPVETPREHSEKLIIVKRRFLEDIDKVFPSREYLVAFKPRDVESARRAGRIDHPISIVFDEENIDLCTREQLVVMRGKRVFIEILARAVLYDEYLPRFMRYAKTCIRRALVEGIDVVLSSGARNLEEAFSPGAFRVLERYLTGIRGSLTYSWFRVLEKWREDLVKRIDASEER